MKIAGSRTAQFAPLAMIIAAMAAASLFSRQPLQSESNGTFTLSTQVFDRLDHFVERNQLPRDGSYYADSDGGILAFQAFASKPSDPEGYVLKVATGNCTVSLPAGRYIQLSYDGAYLTSLDATLPLEPKPFDEIVPMAEQIYRSMVSGGWTTKDYDPDVTPQSIAEFLGGLPQHFYAEMTGCGEEDLTVQINIEYYNALPPGPSVPPVPGQSLPDDYPDRYLISVHFSAYGEKEKEINALAYARRLAETGEKYGTLPFDRWLNDPDWRPEGWNGKFIK